MSGFQINHIVLSGNLTRDPELRTTPGGTSVCSLRLANNTRRKTSDGEWEDKPNYFDVTVWSGMGEWVASNLSKGDRVVVDGRMEWREWKDKDGNKRQAYDVIADSLVTTGGGGGGGGSRSAPAGDVPGEYEDPTPAAAPAGAEDDIPF